MAIKVFMPRLTHDMQAGTLLRWLVSEGEPVKDGEPLFEVETDKAISEVVALGTGILQAVRYKDGESVPIGCTMAFILKEGEPLPEQSEPETVEPACEMATKNKEKTSTLTQLPPSPIGSEENHTLFASPIAKRIADQYQVDLSQIHGSGPRGRILDDDVQAYLSRCEECQGQREDEDRETRFDRIEITRLQQITGRRMLQSVRTIPHFVLEIDVDMTETQRWRSCINVDRKTRVSITTLLVKVVAHGLRLHPGVNATFHGDHVRCHRDINVGVAMATQDGLLVPVIHNADALNLDQIQRELGILRQDTEKGHLSPQSLSGGAITLSNLGMYGIDRFTAIINPPEAAILAAGRVRRLPWKGSGGLELRPIMTLRLSVDHRILDGAIAAPFLVQVKELLEKPWLML
ncbi:MAG: 2-oxo acid dehydrogenase subunit E2 [Anaerolineales bacterium]|nr:2-oxo acid dehydrogenase subunit E2 [Anaerolineales bacterium]